MGLYPTLKSLSVSPWAKEFKSKFGEDPILDNPSDYDYQAALNAGISPSKDAHWDSRFKGLDNPRRILEVPGEGIIDTKFGLPADEEERLTMSPNRMKRLFGDY